MHVLTVTSHSNLPELSQSLVQFLHEDSLVAVEAAGQDAVAQLLKSLNHLRALWQSEGAELIYIVDVPPEGKSSPDEPFVRLILAVSPQEEDAAGGDEIANEIEAQFDAWQTLPDENNELLEKIREHHSESPILSGGDVDAAWDQANDVGEEAVGGSTPTPDQDIVDELGEAVGLIYDDYEPLHTAEKLERRDKHRWELNPASADEEGEKDEEESDL